MKRRLLNCGSGRKLACGDRKFEKAVVGLTILGVESAQILREVYGRRLREEANTV